MDDGERELRLERQKRAKSRGFIDVVRKKFPI